MKTVQKLRFFIAFYLGGGGFFAAVSGLYTGAHSAWAIRDSRIYH
jgi:hypothetical protein